ncbi:MAG: SprT family zinc-dependent metalloprotease [Amaricoccus sp.]
MAGAIRIGEPALEVTLRHSPRARRMVLRVSHAGRDAVLTLPPGVPLAKAHLFLSEQEAWLRGKLALRPGLAQVQDGSTLPLGDGTVTIRASEGGRLVRIGDTLGVPGPASALPVRVAAWLREQAREVCVAASDRHAGTIGKRVGRVTLRDPRSRWGSCTAGGDLMFSWRLILAPSAVLDYVVAHEVAHLAELNHSDRFWRVVRRLCPDFEAQRDWLRRHGAGLHAYDFKPAQPG